MGCYNCKYLKESEKKDGKVSGSVYYCSKIKKYVSGSSDGCDAYSFDSTRKTYVKDEIYNNGRKYVDDDTSPATYLAILILMIILGFLLNVF